MFSKLIVSCPLVGLGYIRSEPSIFAGLSGDNYFHAEELADQCVNFSGTYEVIEHKRKTMKFESSSTIGFSGKKVVITIEKE